MTYDAFLSYSQAVDGELAPKLQSALQRFATPWYRLRTLHVFRDKSGLSATSGLWAAIEKGLAASEWFVLLASPTAAGRPYVDREVAWWLRNRGPGRLLIVLTGGTLAWDPAAGNFDPDRTDALPPALYGAFAEEPLWTDLRWAHETAQLDTRNPRFGENVADLAATLRGTPREALIGEDLKQHRRQLVFLRSGIIALSVFGLIASITTWIAVDQRDAAVAAQRLAVTRSLTAQAENARDSDPRAALRLGTAAAGLRADDGVAEASLVETLLTSPYLATLEPGAGVTSVAYSADGGTAATGTSAGGSDGTVVLWDVADRERPLRIGETPSQLGGVEDLAFAADGRTLAVAHTVGDVVLWDISDPSRPGTLGTALVNHPDRISADRFIWSLAWSPDSRTLAIGGFDDAVLWDVTEREHPAPLGEPLPVGAYVHGVAFSPDGRAFAAASWDGDVLAWDLTDRAAPIRLGQPLPAEVGRVRDLEFAPIGQTLAAVGDDGGLMVWDISDRAPRRWTDRPVDSSSGGLHAVAFAPDARTLATAGSDGSVQVWQLGDRSAPPVAGAVLRGHPGQVDAIAIAPDGRTLLSGGGDKATAWDLTGRDRPRRVGPALGNEMTSAASFAPDGRTLGLGGTADVYGATLWDVSDPDRPRRGQELAGHDTWVNALAFSPDGSVLATADGDGKVLLWELHGPPEPLASALADHDENVNGVAFTPDGGTLLTGGNDKIVRLYDVSDAARPRRFPHPIVTDDSVEALAVDPNRNHHVLVIGGGDGQITLWDLTDPADPRPIGGPLRGHTSAVDSVAIAPSGRLLASGSNDHTVRLWDISEPTRPIAIGQPLTGHEAMVDSVAFSADGRTLATGAQEASAGQSVVLLWDVSVPGRPRRLPGPAVGNVSPVAFAAGRHMLLTGSPQDGPVLWDLSGLDAVRRDPISAACLRAGGALDRDTWTAQAPSIPYLDPCAG